MTSDRPPRLRPLSPETIANTPSTGTGPSDAELFERLDDALAALPEPERTAALVAFGLGNGTDAVAEQQNLAPADAEALARSALQLLRGAMADIELDEPQLHPRLRRRRRQPRRGEAPDG